MCSLSFLLCRLFLFRIVCSLCFALFHFLYRVCAVSLTLIQKRKKWTQFTAYTLSTQANEKCFSTISEAISSMWNISNSKIRREYNHLERTKRKRRRKKIQKNGSHSCLCAVSLNIIFIYEERGKIRCRRTNRKKNKPAKGKKKKKYIYDVK